MVDLSVDDVGYGARLFAHDDAYDVDLLAYADSGTMAKAEVGVDLVVGGYGEDATGGQDGVFLYYDGTIVKGGVFEEESFQKRSRGGGVDTLACGYDVVKFVLAFEDDEGARLGLGHVHACLDVGFYVERRTLRYVVFPEEESFAEGVACEGGLGAYEEEKFANFGLEDDDESDEADAHNLAEECARETHVEEIGDLACDDDDEDGPEDAYDVGAANEAVEVEKESGNQKDVDDVDKTDGMESCNKCGHERV